MLNSYNEPMVVYHNPPDNVTEDAFSDYIKRHTCDKKVTYKTVDSENLEICYFFPLDYDKNKKYPLLIAIHGGGWGSRFIMNDQNEWSGDYLGYLLRYYADKGYIGAMCTYRLLQNGQKEERQLIHLYEDCQDALNYVADHSEEHGIDLNKVILLGESAGGHLAGGMATDSFYENRLPIKLAILVNPILNLFKDEWGGRCLDSTMHPLLKGMTKAEIQMLLSPLFHIKPNNCDVLLIHGSEDKVVDIENSFLFNRAMTQMGLNSELHIINGSVHAFLCREYYKNPAHTVAGVEIIDKYLCKHNYL